MHVSCYFNVITSDTLMYDPSSSILIFPTFPVVRSTLTGFIHSWNNINEFIRSAGEETLSHLEQHNILHDCQHGFRAKRSCETQLLTLTHELAQSLDKRIQTDMVILDFSKAFDHVPHQRLLKKVHHYGVRGQTHKWITSFLQDKTQKVIVDGESSEVAPVVSGVP